MVKLFQHAIKKRTTKPNAEVEIKLHTFFISGFQRRDRSAFCTVLSPAKVNPIPF